MDNLKMKAQPASEAGPHLNHKSRAQESMPEYWDLVTLEKVADFVNGYAFKPSQWSEGGRPIIRIQNLTGTSEKINHFDGELPERYLVRNGDLLISWSASLGAFVWRGEEAWVNQHIFKVTNLRDNIDKEFLLFVLQVYIEDIKGKTRGSTMKHVTRKEFLATTIPLPPVPEQRSIAHILSTIQKALETTEKVINASRELKRSLMNHLFTYGPVPVDEAEQVPLKETEIGPVPECWEAVRLKDLLRERLRNGHSAKATNTDEGVRTLTLSAVTQNEFSIERTKLTVADPKKVAGLWLQAGDILIERANTKNFVGLAALYDGPDDFAIYPDLMVRVRVKEELINPKFVAEFLLMKQSRSYFRLNARGTAGNMPKIDHGTIENALIPLPPSSEQEDIVHTFLTIDQKIATEEVRKETLQALFNTLLHNLMAGNVRVGDLNVSEVEGLVR